jgi:hypothetical protein
MYGADVTLHGAQDVTDTNFLQVDAGLCSKRLMDFYLQVSGDWQFYDHDGDGTLLGTCSNDIGGGVDACSGIQWYQRLNCTTSVCGT